MKLLPRMVWVIVVMLGSACGEREFEAPPNSVEGDPSEENVEKKTTRDRLVPPPRQYYEALFIQKIDQIDNGYQLTSTGTQTLFLDFDGADLSKGFGPGQSFLLCQPFGQLPESGLDEDAIDQIVAQVQQYFNDADAELDVTSSLPTGDFTTVHVGGSASDLGCEGDDGLAGLAPLDLGNANLNDVGFVFLGNEDFSLDQIAAEISHQAGHSFGLSHVLDTQAMMSGELNDDFLGFATATLGDDGALQDAPAILQGLLGSLGDSSGDSSIITAIGGGNSPIDGIPNLPTNLAGLPGLDQLAQIAELLPDLGGDDVVDISTLMPQFEQLLPAGTQLPEIDKVITLIALASEAGVVQAGGEAGTQPIDPGIAAAILGAATGAAGGTGGEASGLDAISAMATMAGHPEVAIAISVIQLLINSQSSQDGDPQEQQPVATQPALPLGLPDLSALLQIESEDGDLPDILRSLSGSGQVIQSNFSGTTQDALLSMTKVAYAQAFQKSLARSFRFLP